MKVPPRDLSPIPQRDLAFHAGEASFPGDSAGNQEVLAALIARDSTTFDNLGQEIFRITGDRIRLTLRDFEDHLAQGDRWMTSLSLFLSLLTTLIATEFKSALGLGADVWKAMFCLGTVVSFGWFLWGSAQRIRRRKMGIEDILSRLKESR